VRIEKPSMVFADPLIHRPPGSPGNQVYTLQENNHK
jgi:hypothetical protein